MSRRAPRVVRLGIRVRRERAEMALAALLPLLGAGAEETEPARRGRVRALRAARRAARRPSDPRARPATRCSACAAADVPAGWERRWHAHLRPVEAPAGAARSARRGSAGATARELVIDPGAMFGAGAHPTTRLCLELLLELEPAGALCDWGAGSGVLAVAAARLGWRP